MSTVHVHAPQPDRVWLDRDNCPDCKRRSYFVNRHTPWYGIDSTCMRCGRRWCDGERMPLDFYRFARQDSKQAARNSYKRFIAREDSQ